MSKSEGFTHEQEVEFMALLGTCITEWSWIEEELYEICQLILGTVQVHTSIIYYRTPTLDSRLGLADEIMSTIFPTPESGKHPHGDAGVWSKLLAEIKKAMPLRNQLAHSPTAAGIFGFQDEQTGTIDEVVEIKMQNSPHHYEMNRPNKPNKKLLLKGDLDDHLDTVRKLHTRLRTFRHDMLRAHVKKRFPHNFPA